MKLNVCTRLITSALRGLGILPPRGASSAILLLLSAGGLRASSFEIGQAADYTVGDYSRMTSGAWGMRNPGGVAVDPVTHKVFVADTNNHRVLRYGSAASLMDGSAAEAVLGQPEFQSTDTAVPVGARSMSYPTGLAVDRTGHLWVADTGNHRVLRFDAASALGSGAPAAGVLGQTSFTSGTGTIAQNRMTTPNGVAVSGNGSLWVADSYNNRVLRFDNAAALANGMPASGVLGQQGWDAGPDGYGPAGMNFPTALAVEDAVQPGTPPVYTPVRLWVADSYNNRVLMFSLPGSAANGAGAVKVLGQQNFNSTGNALLPGGMNSPRGLAAAGGRLWVADNSHNRVLRFDSAWSKANGAPADGVLGQQDFYAADSFNSASALRYPSSVACDGDTLWVARSQLRSVVRFSNAPAKANGAAADSVLGLVALEAGGALNATTFGTRPHGVVVDPVFGKLFVADRLNDRVLRFPRGHALPATQEEINAAGAQAEAVFGQDDFTARDTEDHWRANRMWNPTGLAMDHHGHLWVADTENNRVLRFDNASTAPSGSAAAMVLGQASFTANDRQPGTAANRLSVPRGVAVEESYDAASSTWTTHRLWVADTGNHRVLRFDNPVALTNGAAASHYFGAAASWTTATGSAGPFGMNEPHGLCVDSAGTLWVADTGNKRVLRFTGAAAKSNGPAANGVLLQPSYSLPLDGLPPTASLGDKPVGVCTDATGRLFVADFGYQRVLWFDNAAALPSGSPASGVLGAPNFTTPGSGSDSFDSTGACIACTVDFTGRLWVCSQGITSSRLMRFTPDPENWQEWQYRHFASIHPLIAGESADRDGDRVPNLMEYAQDTDPNDPASGRETTLAMNAAGRPVITFALPEPARPDVRLKLQMSPSLGYWLTMTERAGTGPWTGGWPAAAGLGINSLRYWNVTHTSATNISRQFYRLNAELLP